MIAALLIGSLFAGMWAESAGSRAARPLIASIAFVCVLTILKVQFYFALWLTIDVAVICAIERLGPITDRERAIFALFPPAWVLYHMQPPGWPDAVSVIVSLQLLLTVPWDRLEQRIWKARAA